jgi:hypothetical protein
MAKRSMSVAKLQAVKELPPTPMVLEGSWGAQQMGTHASTMRLFIWDGQAGRGAIEWDIPGLERVEEIGLTWDNDRNIIDYDGVFSIPREAVEFLREQGFTVTSDVTGEEEA